MTRAAAFALAGALCAAVPAFAALPGPATTAERGGVARGVEAAPARALQSGISLDAAVELVQRRYGGRVVRAETREERGQTVHRIRLLSDDGRVTTVTVDARTGRID